MEFNYYNKFNKIEKCHIQMGDEWNSLKDKLPSPLNSIFNSVDLNFDGKVDKEELDILQKLLKIADSQIENTKGNNIIENEELDLLVNKIKTRQLDTLEGNKHPGITMPKIINIPEDKDKLKSYKYLGTYCEWGEAEDGSEDIMMTPEIVVDCSAIDNLEEGKYYVEYWKQSYSEETGFVLTPVVHKIQDSNQDGTINWSEGINRNISKIQVAKSKINSELVSFLNKVGDEQGFSVELLDIDGEALWAEDLSIVRADKKQLIPNCETGSNIEAYNNESKITAKRRHVSLQAQGSAFQRQQANEDPVAIKYSHTLSQEDIVAGRTYLEGGNVLNTLTKDGEPGAIIGEESIKYSMIKLGLDDSEASVNIAKKQIAEELGIEEKNVTYIPQFDFHIDMFYRPLNNGQIGIPDYEAGIKILETFIQDINKKLEASSETTEAAGILLEEKKNLENRKQEYLKLIGKLKEMASKTEEIAADAENKLKEQGYEIIKIPCFTEIDKGEDPTPNATGVENPINYMNAICGTSAKTGEKFYITNTSGDDNLDAYMETFLKDTVGFDKIYFAPTKKYLSALGGIDCLTKEL